MKYIVRFFDIGALTFFSAMFLSTMVEFVSRNFLQVSAYWTEETSRLFCVWCVFFGAASAWFRKSHIVIDTFVQRLRGRIKSVFEHVTLILNCLFLIIVWYGTLTLMKVSYHVKTTNLEISISYYYLGLFIGLSGMIVYHFKEILSRSR